MLQIGRLQGSFLVITCVVIVLVCFGAGFVAAVFLGGMDTATAAAVAGTVVAKSEFAVRTRGSLLSQGQQIARRPVFALSKFAARPVQGLYRRVPGALAPLSPQMALDQALRSQVSAVDQAVVSTTSTAANGVQASVGAAGDMPAAAAPGAMTAGTTGTGPGPTGATLAGAAATGAAAKTAVVAGDGTASSTALEAMAQGKLAPAEAAPMPEVPRRNLPPATAPGMFYSIELATFLQPDTLKAFVAEMQRRRLPVAILDETDASGRDWHYVRLGPFPTQEQAVLRLAELRRDHGLSGVVVSETPAASTVKS